MSAAMALRLLFGVLCGGVLAWVVWDRSERELADRAGREEHERPRFLPFGGYYYLPMMMLLYPILGVIVGGAQMAVQLTLCALMRVFLELGVYYVLLMAVMPWLRRCVSITPSSSSTTISLSTVFAKSRIFCTGSGWIMPNFSTG